MTHFFACMNLQFGRGENQPQLRFHTILWCSLLPARMMMIMKESYFFSTSPVTAHQPVLITVNRCIAIVCTIHSMLPLLNHLKTLQPIQILSRFLWPMNFQMPFGAAQWTDALLTVQAAVKLFSNLSSFMIYFQQPKLENVLPTEAPLVRLLSGVNPLVLFN